MLEAGFLVSSPMHGLDLLLSTNQRGELPVIARTMEKLPEVGGWTS
jgi:hypothetical protein